MNDDYKVPQLYNQDELDEATRQAHAEAITGDTSDGYHTFNELYEHRHSLFSVVCGKFNGWKSKLHSDGTMFEGCFIAGVQTPLGQVTYHIPLGWWERFHCAKLNQAPTWDGHMPNDVIKRIQSLTPTLARIEAELRTAEAVHEEACRWFNKCQFNSPKTGPTHMAEIMESSVFSEVEETESRVAALRRERDAEKAKVTK